MGEDVERAFRFCSRNTIDFVQTLPNKVASFSSIPVCAGFGIRSAADVISVGEHASGAIVGSALVEVLESGEDPRPFLRSLGGK